MTASQVVAASVAVLALLLTALSIHVSRLRLRHRVSFGDGGHKDLLIAIRAHGNALEQSMLYGLLALAYSLVPGAHLGLLAACAGLFVVARVVHAVALFGRRWGLRPLAHVVSMLVQLALALAIGWALWHPA